MAFPTDPDSTAPITMTTTAFLGLTTPFALLYLLLTLALLRARLPSLWHPHPAHHHQPRAPPHTVCPRWRRCLECCAWAMVVAPLWPLTVVPYWIGREVWGVMVDGCGGETERGGPPGAVEESARARAWREKGEREWKGKEMARGSEEGVDEDDKVVMTSACHDGQLIPGKSIPPISREHVRWKDQEVDQGSKKAEEEEKEQEQVLMMSMGKDGEPMIHICEDVGWKGCE